MVFSVLFLFFHTRFVSNHNHDDNERKRTFAFPGLLRTLYRLLFVLSVCINTTHHYIYIYIYDRHICWYKINKYIFIYVYILESSPKSNTRGARVGGDIMPAVQLAKKLNYTFSFQIFLERRLQKTRIHELLRSFIMYSLGRMMSVVSYILYFFNVESIYFNLSMADLWD